MMRFAPPCTLALPHRAPLPSPRWQSTVLTPWSSVRHHRALSQALYLEPKQTPAGHMPAHILFLIAGILAVGSA